MIAPAEEEKIVRFVDFLIEHPDELRRLLEAVPQARRYMQELFRQRAIL